MGSAPGRTERVSATSLRARGLLGWAQGRGAEALSPPALPAASPPAPPRRCLRDPAPARSSPRPRGHGAARGSSSREATRRPGLATIS